MAIETNINKEFYKYHYESFWAKAGRWKDIAFHELKHVAIETYIKFILLSTYYSLPNTQYSIHKMFRGLLLILLNILITGAFLSGQTDLSKGLRAYYPFEGEIKDYGPRNVTVTVFGSPVLAEDRFGKAGNACSFDGKDDYLVIDIGRIEEIGISLWFNMPFPVNDYPTLFDYGDKALYSQIDAFTGASMPAFNYCKVAMMIQSEATIAYSSYAPEQNQWHHLYISAGGKDQIPLLYLDGYQNSELPDFYSFIYRNFSIYVGRLANSQLLGRSYFSGSIDDLRIYDRFLSDEEVYELYNEKGYKVSELCRKEFSINYDYVMQKLYISNLKAVSEIKKIIIYNNIGEALMIKVRNFESGISLGFLKKGVYLVNVIGEKGETKGCKRIVIL
ncbi:MAG: LamG domain-containing protein [Bacteroidales bacterium]|nr:LamG domain-containing protein [Bacteroidales bacterium]